MQLQGALPDISLSQKNEGMCCAQLSIVHARSLQALQMVAVTTTLTILDCNVIGHMHHVTCKSRVPCCNAVHVPVQVFGAQLRSL